ncbi:MAG: hypothetical protein MPJ24_07740 [Pirellulaceae bacterium]|nr:hypothetical protein [Pirellulaceae bacterium]
MPVLSLLLFLGGCQLLERPLPNEEDIAQVLANPKINPDSVVLEVAIVRFREDELQDDVWLRADEQLSSVTTQLALQKNGLRVGNLGNRLPPDLEELIHRRELTNDKSSTSQQFSNQAKQHEAFHALTQKLQMIRRLQTGAGKRNEIVLVTYPGLRQVQWHQEGQEQEADLQEAKFVLNLYARPLGDSSVEINLEPEIQHGPLRQAYHAEEGDLRYSLQQQKQKFQHLNTKHRLKPGQTILVGAADHSRHLGKAFFTFEQGEETYHTFLLVRLALVQSDDRFQEKSAIDLSLF